MLNRPINMKYETGWKAGIAAGFDQLKTLATFREPAIVQGLYPSREGDSRTVFHFRGGGEYVPVKLPNGNVIEMNEATIVHQYERGQLIERKRVKDKPQGFEVYNSSVVEAAEALVQGILNDRMKHRE